MRINVYAEEMTDRIEWVEKSTDDGDFVGLRMYQYLPVTINEVDDPNEGWMPDNRQGPFIHRPGDDDSAAITFWGKRKLYRMLRKSLEMMQERYQISGGNLKGDRVGALLSATDGVAKVLGYGEYSGMEIPPDEVGGMKIPGMTNPKITLDNGDVVWGCECWWASEAQIRARIADMEVVEVRIGDVRAENAQESE